VLQGSVVGLEATGSGAAWSIGSASEFRAASGDLELRVPLQSATGAAMSFVVPNGRFLMLPDTSIQSVGGLVSVHAKQGISVTAIDASWGLDSERLSGGVALDATSGTVALATPNKGGVRAESFSMYGFGPKGESADLLSLRVEARNVQVSAPSGIVFESTNAAGALNYRLLSRGVVYEQFQAVGVPTALAILPRSIVAGHPEHALAATTASADRRSDFGFASQIETAMQSRVSRETSPGEKTKAYLKRLAAEIASGVSFVKQVTQPSSFDPKANDADLLSDLAYGLNKNQAPSFVLGQPGLQSTSTGSPAGETWLFDYSESLL